MISYEELMQKAIDISNKAYCPYSNFPVGAALVTDSGKVYCGCNFENSSYGMTICAERNAVGSAIADGERIVKAIAIYSPKQDNCAPCGACRQVLHEFCNNDDELDIILKDGEGYRYLKLSQLLPESFSI